MRAGRFLLLAAVTLGLGTGARAQATDEFSGGLSPALPWRWDVPGNTPVNTQNPAYYAFTPATLDLSFSPGGLYGPGGGARNLPNLLVWGQPENWFLETAVSIDWSRVGLSGYTQANLAIFDDADNFFFLHYVQDAAQPGRVFVSTNVQNAARGAQHGRRPRGGDLGRDTAGFVRLRIEGTPDRITLSYDAGAGLQSVGTLSAASTGNALASWDYLSEGLAGKRVGLFAGLGGGQPATTPARYDYLSTDLNVIPEPGSAVLLVAAALPLMGLARRRWRRA